MPATIQRPHPTPSSKPRVTPSVVDPTRADRFSLDQELKPFGRWASESIWVPPKDESRSLAETMLRETRPFTSPEVRWQAVVEKHRSEFTQVREFDLFQASIRLPKGRFFMSVTEPQHFDTITDEVPACVQTRLDEFLAGPGKKRGVKVYYLKPLCVESGDELILTTRDDVNSAIDKIQAEVFDEYRRHAFAHRTTQALAAVANLALALPRKLMADYVARRQRAIDAYQARLEFKRRKTAMGAARNYRKCRTDGCSFDDMLALTNPLNRIDVIDQFCIEEELSKVRRRHLMQMTANTTLPWFVTLSFTLSSLVQISSLVYAPVVVADPVFVAEMPGSDGVLLNIGHFDEVGGVTHVVL